MRKFSITVNGQTYEVEVSEIKNGQTSMPVMQSPIAAPRTTVVQPTVQTVSTQTVTSGEGDIVNSPMPGKVVYVNRAVGEVVEEGDEVLVLEAMKMGNPIIAPKNGTITSMLVKEGQNVQGGDVLFTIK